MAAARPARSHLYAPGHPKYGGRVKGTPNKRTLLITEACQAMAPQVLERLAKIAQNYADLNSAVRAAQLILAYAYGKPKESVNITGDLKITQEVEQAALLTKRNVLTLVKGARSGNGDARESDPAPSACASA